MQRKQECERRTDSCTVQVHIRIRDILNLLPMLRITCLHAVLHTKRVALLFFCLMRRVEERVVLQLHCRLVSLICPQRSYAQAYKKYEYSKFFHKFGCKITAFF